MLQELLWLRQITRPTEAAEVCGVGLDGVRITVGPDQDGEAGIAEAQAQPPRAAEEIDRGRTLRGAHPPADLGEIRRVRRIAGRLEAQCGTSVVRHRGAPSGGGFAHDQTPLSGFHCTEPSYQSNLP
jgi:hypothetical protein